MGTKNPTRYCKISPGIVRGAAMPHVLLDFSPRNLKALHHQQGVEVSRESDRLSINNRATNLHLPYRRGERAMLRFSEMNCLQKFASVQASVYNHFNRE